MSQGQSNPLFMHGIVLFVVAAALLVAGVFKISDGAKEMPEQKQSGTQDSSVMGQIRAGQKAQSEAYQAKSDLNNLGTAPSMSVSGVTSKMATAKRLGDKTKALKNLGPLVPGILMCVVALATAACGLFVLKQANWARLTGFGLVSLTLLYFTWEMAVRNSVMDETTGQPLNEFSVLWPIGITVIAILAGKFLWDLAIEKFDAQPAAA